MIENLPLYIVVIFILTTLVTVGIFQNAFKRASFNSRTANFLNFVLPFWLVLQATLAVSGFYRLTDTMPPRLITFAIFPAILLILALFIFSKDVIVKLPLKTLTIIHIIRLPVEIVLFLLFQNNQVPQIMTFEGRNFDIVIGLTAPIIFWLAFRKDELNKPLLIIWNLFGIIFLFNIVIHAALSLPSELQQISFDQPNKAVLYFPFNWLPSTIVPIILFCNSASLYKLLQKK